MRLHANLFVKITVLLFTIISITLLLYGLSYKKDVGVITEQIKTSDLNHLDFFTKQMDNNVNQLAGLAYTLQRDPTIREYEHIQDLQHLIDPNKTTLTVLEKLALQTSSSTWENQINIYNIQKRETLSSDASVVFEESLLKKPLAKGWNYDSSMKMNSSDSGFRLLLADPVDFAETPELSNMIIEVRFPVSNLQKMIGEYQYYGDTFLYHPKLGLIKNQNLDTNLATGIMNNLQNIQAEQQFSTTVYLQGKQYLVSMIRSTSLGWYMIHYSPLEQILHPIRTSRVSFITASFVLLALSTLFSLIMFRQVQRPIGILLRAVNKMKEGYWSTRIRTKANNEFSILNQGFNEMAQKVQELIERVYLEQLRAKDAYLKQLQAQINPHFLYNCLNFMKSKARVGDTASVEAMALNLGEYYRYITRMDHSLTTIGQEMKLVESYLSIQNLRKQRIDYSISITDVLLTEPIPKLLIQPIVENSIIHGIEKKLGGGRIMIHGEIKDDTLIISVEDNGAGMDPHQMEELYAVLDTPIREDGGCGLWNVQQRLKHQYGGLSGLLIEPSELGGVKVTLRIQKKGLNHVTNTTR
ncbi:histidine kinase [Paenibacillus sp. HWE-109]|uniref:sensor histidine kinase n=1 Tax=Paenibacillus sp. HWE-109 TaxID=1306526 RepID=UPI001EE0E572|nr:histidine kinase [Paenibacillus sp. HWE-109]UKS28213.1 histidine kinase [Paenibacillus sp. HWE-109]